MVSQSVLIVVIVILSLVVLVALLRLAYATTNDKIGNKSCKAVAGKFSIYSPFFLIQFSPLVPLCDLIAPS
jgi:hypothetical protein